MRNPPFAMCASPTWMPEAGGTRFQAFSPLHRLESSRVTSDNDRSLSQSPLDWDWKQVESPQSISNSTGFKYTDSPVTDSIPLVWQSKCAGYTTKNYHG